MTVCDKSRILKGYHCEGYSQSRTISECMCLCYDEGTKFAHHERLVQWWQLYKEITKKQGFAEMRNPPVPPLEVQREIVTEIEGYQRVIDGARAVIDNYRPQIVVDPEWPMVEIGKACIVNPRKSELVGLDGAIIVSFVPMSDMGENSMYFDLKDVKNLQNVGSSYTYFRDGDILIAKVTPCFENGKAGIAKDLSNGIGFGSSEFYVLRPTESVISQWIYLCVVTPVFRKWATPQMTGTGGLQRVPRSVIENYKIPIPSPESQQSIIAEIEAEQALVAANRELIKRFEKKIQLAVERVWNTDASKTTKKKAIE